MGYIFTFNDAKAYTAWEDSPAHQAAFQREARLMTELLNPLPGRRFLDVGCGTGNGLMMLRDSGLSLTGLDPSPYMLDAARAMLGNRADLHRGIAEDLPFEDNAFHYVSLVKTLEFVNDPQKAIAEACRVAKDRVFIGILNRRAINKSRRQLKRYGDESFMDKAKAFKPGEVKHMVRQIMGKVPITCRSLCPSPFGSERMARCLETSFLQQHCAFGDFTGVLITPTPRFRTRPLSVPCASQTGVPEVL